MSVLQWEKHFWGGDAVVRKIQEILLGKDIDFEIIHHQEPIRSAQQGAEFFGIEIGQTAPTLVLETEKGYVTVVYSGDRGRLNLNQIAKLLGYEQVKLASPQTVEKETGYQIGAVPMVGLSFPCLLDRQLFRFPFVYGGTGELTSTLKISPASIEQLNQVVAFIE